MASRGLLGQRRRRQSAARCLGFACHMGADLHGSAQRGPACLLLLPEVLQACTALHSWRMCLVSVVFWALASAVLHS